MTDSSDRRCLITGGAGFVGSHLCDTLLAEGAHVTVVDNLSTGRTANIDHLRGHPRFEFVRADVSNLAVMTPLAEGCTELYHLASYVGVRLASQTSSQTILNNLRSIDTVLELATRFKPRLLLTSTSEIYGKALDGRGTGVSRLNEQSDRVYGPTEVHRWSYSGIKAVEEFLTLAKSEEEDLRAVIVRLFNVIGPRQQGLNGPVVPRLVEQALAGRPLTVYNDGRQLRCFTDVSDAVRAVLALMRTPAATGGVFNVGNDQPTMIRELAETIIDLTGSRSTIEFVPYESVYGTQFEDVVVRIPDVSKLHAFTGLRCERPLRETLSDIVSSYRAVLEAGR